MRNYLCSLLLALAMAPAALASHYASFYVLPMSGHAEGANDTMWVSDIGIQNFQAEPLTVSLVFIQAGTSSFDNVGPLTDITIPAHGSVLLHDVVKDFRGLANVTGAIMAGADKPFAITSRAYDATSGVGHEVHASRDFLDNTTGTTDNALATAYIPGLISNAAFRSNLGFAAGTVNGSSPMTISVTVRNAAGVTLGTSTFEVPAGGALQQFQIPLSAVTTATFDIGSAEYRITSGSGTVVPYATVVGNTTADGVFIAGTFPPNSTINGSAALLSPFANAFRRATVGF